MKKLKSILLCGLLATAPAYAQFSIDGQLVQRAEYRHGFGALFDESDKPAVFIGQRARLQANYRTDEATFYMSIQDVRIWGNTPQVKATDGLLSVHEAWAELNLSEHWKLKLGRQELNYDNFRFLGNLDWALQARAHDFALAKYEKEAFKLHIGGGFNQNGEQLTDNFFTVGNQYKVAQLLRAENTWGNFQASFLFWNDGRQFRTLNPLGQVTDQGVRFAQTIGLPTLKYQAGSVTLSGFAYYQLGKNTQGQTLNAYNVSGQVSKLWTINEEKGRQYRLTGGLEILSGTDSDEDPGTSHSYSPLYGTNHLFNGYMDLFFVGGRYERVWGLNDLFIRTRYDFNKEFFLALSGHYFSTNAQVILANQTLDSSLGGELDFSLGWVINKAFSLQCGYSHLFASETLQDLYNRPTPSATQNWAYTMLIYRPTMKNRFIGLLF